MFIIICSLSAVLVCYFPIIFLAFFCSLFNKMVTKKRAETMKFNREFLLKKTCDFVGRTLGVPLGAPLTGKALLEQFCVRKSKCTGLFRSSASCIIVIL